MKIFVSVCVLLSLECITGLDPALDGDPRQTFPARRSIDGSRGRKYYVPEEDTFDIHGFGGQYDPYRDTTDFSDIRINVPGEPGVDYPSYVTIPQTSFQCQSEFKGYYADEEAGCQLFHICDANFLVSSFLCPIGSIFSQQLLTCNWWNKVDCLSTQNYYTVNRDSLLIEVDDDEILRKAYEMTSLQTSQKGISIDSRTRNSIFETARFVSEIQTSPIHYDDDHPDVQYKYSSRYNAPNYRDRGSYHPMLTENNQWNPKIRVHTIGQDNKNDVGEQIRDFRPSYAPTVPTVTTTTRRFYSPTVPATSARPMSRPRHDLEFESSDHLYSARGKTSGTSASPPVTKPTIDSTTSVVGEVPPILSDAYHLKTEDTASALVETAPEEKIVTETSEVTMDTSQVLTEFSAIEYQSLHSDKNYTFQIDVDNSHPYAQQTTAAEIPSIHIIPPFFYYSNIDQHNAASASKVQETNTTSLKQFIIDVSATDIIPPLFNDSYNETAKNYADIQVMIPTDEVQPASSEGILNVSIIIQNAPKTKENGSPIEHSFPPPSKLFLPPFDDFQLENSTNVIPHDAQEGLNLNDRANRVEKSRESTESESSPFLVTRLVKGEKFNLRRELIKSSIAQHDSFDDFRDVEIEKSQRTTDTLSDPQNTTTSDSSATDDISRAQIINYTVFNELQRIHRLRSLKTLQNRDHLPRPFSLDTRKVVPLVPSSRPSSLKGEKLTSENSSHEHGELKKKKEIIQPLAQTIPLELELPHVTRTIDFRSATKLKNTEEQMRGEEEDENEEEHKRPSDRDNTSVDTEFIPSIGFSLNTAKERKEYTKAVMRGYRLIGS